MENLQNQEKKLDKNKKQNLIDNSIKEFKSVLKN